jgi:hypothetical protein
MGVGEMQPGSAALGIGNSADGLKPMMLGQIGADFQQSLICQ